jgi:iron complex transport system substrate-binding protein
VLIAILLSIVFGAAYVARRNASPGADAGSDAAPASRPERIVSLAPSVTECLFAVGLGPRVRGVTRYCLYPEPAGSLPRIGGYFDPNYEAILGLKPDLVVMLREHTTPMEQLTALGLRTLAVGQQSVEGILASILEIGRVGGEADRARDLVAGLRARMGAVEEKTRGLPRPRVLVSAGRNAGGGALTDVFIAGRGNFLEDILRAAGGENAYDGSLPFPSVSAEGILRMNPDVIVDMVPTPANRAVNVRATLDEWNVLTRVRAVESGRVYVLTEDFVSIPGPRFILILEKLSRVLHPEVKWAP